MSALTPSRRSIRGAISRASTPSAPQKAERLPVCVYFETTNRCNLLCTTCPRTYAELEPPADMSWALFTSIVDQIPHLERAVMHGVGEPMLVKNLPKMVRYLKDRGTYVLFNTNGTVLNDKNGRALIDAGLDELRVSLDASNAASFLADSRQGFLQPHPAQRAPLPRAAGARRARAAAGLGLADRPQGDNRRTAGIRAGRGRHRRQGSLSAAARLSSRRCHRQCASGSGAVRADDARRRRSISTRRLRSRVRLA